MNSCGKNQIIDPSYPEPEGYTIQGWAMDVERLKKRYKFTDDYILRVNWNTSA